MSLRDIHIACVQAVHFAVTQLKLLLGSAELQVGFEVVEFAYVLIVELVAMIIGVEILVPMVSDKVLLAAAFLTLTDVLLAHVAAAITFVGTLLMMILTYVTHSADRLGIYPAQMLRVMSKHTD
jgi:hypothetical protein